MAAFGESCRAVDVPMRIRRGLECTPLARHKNKELVAVGGSNALELRDELARVIAKMVEICKFPVIFPALSQGIRTPGPIRPLGVSILPDSARLECPLAASWGN